MRPAIPPQILRVSITKFSYAAAQRSVGSPGILAANGMAEDLKFSENSFAKIKCLIVCKKFHILQDTHKCNLL